MILWNTSGKLVQGKFNGKVFTFQPDENDGCKRRIGEDVIVNHLYFKLCTYGIVKLPDDGITDELIKSERLKGIKARRKMLEGRLRNYRTMNKEREAAKLSPEQPTDIIIETCEELDQVDAILKTINKAAFESVDRRLNTLPEETAEDNINQRELKVETGTSRSRVTGGKPVAKPKTKQKTGIKEPAKVAS